MSTPGQTTMAALMGVRQLLAEVQGLLGEAARLLDRHGWVDASPSRKASHLSNAWDDPANWMPRYLYRWYRSEAMPEVRLVLVVHLCQEDGLPPQPWVVLAAYVGTSVGPTVREADEQAAGLHVEGEEATASGRVLETPLEVGRKLSVAVPLLDVVSATVLDQRLVAPMMARLRD